mmetsp:Transcript_32152/g.80078  ORF Transcript_32152/g.80078 Transcript_32152/m.80078 type:complete len:298 (+) Transcript_32152:264-1157(+)
MASSAVKKARGTLRNCASAEWPALTRALACALASAGPSSRTRGREGPPWRPADLSCVAFERIARRTRAASLSPADAPPPPDCPALASERVSKRAALSPPPPPSPSLAAACTCLAMASVACCAAEYSTSHSSESISSTAANQAGRTSKSREAGGERRAAARTEAMARGSQRTASREGSSCAWCAMSSRKASGARPSTQASTNRSAASGLSCSAARGSASSEPAVDASASDSIALCERNACRAASISAVATRSLRSEPTTLSTPSASVAEPPAMPCVTNAAHLPTSASHRSALSAAPPS